MCAWSKTDAAGNSAALCWVSSLTLQKKMAQCLIKGDTLLTEICGWVLDISKYYSLPSEAKFIVIFLTVSRWMRGRYRKHLRTNKWKEKGGKKERMKLVVVWETILVTRTHIFYSSESFQAVPARPSGTNTL